MYFKCSLLRLPAGLLLRFPPSFCQVWIMLPWSHGIQPLMVQSENKYKSEASRTAANLLATLLSLVDEERPLLAIDAVTRLSSTWTNLCPCDFFVVATRLMYLRRLMNSNAFMCWTECNFQVATAFQFQQKGGKGRSSRTKIFIAHFQSDAGASMVNESEQIL